MISKYTLVGDPHAKLNNLDKINKLFDIAEELNNPVIILGDLLDTKDVVRARCLNTYYERFKKSKLEFIVLVGNHDLVSLHSAEHSLEPLKALPNVTIIDSPQTINGIGFFPFSKDTESQKAKLKDLNTRYVVGHFDIFGFDYGNGFISDVGLKREDFSHFAQVISGHYHKFSNGGNVLYLGTPFSHSFGESNQNKFIAEWDVGDNSFSFIPTPFPRHKTFEVDCETEETHPEGEVGYTRVILKGSEQAIKGFKRVLGYKYIEQLTESQDKAIIQESQSIEAQFKKWAEINKYDSDLTNLGLEYLK